MGWEDYSEARPNAISSDTRKACDYATKLSGSLSIGFTRHDEYTIERKGLEESFQKTLEMTSDKLTYQKVSDGIGDQSIYFFGEKGPNFIYNLKWRYGNHTEKTIYLRATKEQNPEEILEKLKSIANKL